EALAFGTETSQIGELAALVASKVHFHCNAKQSALALALKAGNRFDLNEKSDYAQTVINAAIDQYIEHRKSLGPKELTSDESNPYKEILERIVQQSLQSPKSYDKILGIALESRRADILLEVLKKGDKKALLPFLQSKCLDFVGSYTFRMEVYRLIRDVQSHSSEVSHESICQCFMKLDAAKECAEYLLELIKGPKESDALTALQLGFDLYENSAEEFLKGVSAHLESFKEAPSLEKQGAAIDPVVSIDRLTSILSGEVPTTLKLHFLSRNNKADERILERTLKSFGTSSSIYNNALSLAHAFMYAGTTDDQFMRDNHAWMQGFSQWSQFATTSSLGVLHHGHAGRAIELLSPYLPTDARENRPYEEAGAFLALGLICAGQQNAPVVEYLQSALRNINEGVYSDEQKNLEVMYHGVCLGLGTALLGNESGSVTSTEGGGESTALKLYDVLQTDSAVASEAAAVGIGLTLMGSADLGMVETLIDYAEDTEHEKIIRGIASAIALIMFDLQEQADDVIDRLCKKEDPLLRLAAAQTIAMAYCGTGNNEAIRKLLHMAVSDVNDDVRRAAVTGLGFVFLRSPEHVPRMVQLLSDSYNPHVRYGSALALGIACAGTGSLEAISILEPMLKDSADFVIQGALIAMAMILIQHNEHTNSKVEMARNKFEQLISDRYTGSLTKFGAALAQGIIDAGGRNVTISMVTKWDNLKREACAGVFLFTQFWHWFPFAQYLSLAFVPTGIIGVNKNLAPPEFEIKCKGRKEVFDYPPKIVTQKQESKINLPLTQLSTTKTRLKVGKKADTKAKPKEDAMEVEQVVATASTARGVDGNSNGSANNKGSVSTVGGASQMFTIANMSRVLPLQEEYVEWGDPSVTRYTPVVKNRVSGIVVLSDSRPSEPEKLIRVVMETEAPPPEPFEYPFSDDA
ncbi:proteasome regulatory particle base subunit, partial [Spiromyces aspiralis]